jgi:hypothetical protein
MKAILVSDEIYEDIVATDEQGLAIGTPFYIASDDDVITVFSKDLKQQINEFEGHMAILDKATKEPDFFYDMPTEWNVQERNASEFVEIDMNEVGEYEIV